MEFKKTVIYDVVILICAAFLLTVSTLMWFQINKTVQSSGVSLTSGSTPSISFEFYIAETPEQWNSATRLELSKLVPGQTVYCKLCITNNGHSNIAASVDFMSILDGVSEDNYLLSDVLIFEGVPQTGVSFADTNTFSYLMAETDHFKAVLNAVISPGQEIPICFNLSVDSQAGNEYSEKTLSVEQIKITTSNVGV